MSNANKNANDPVTGPANGSTRAERRVDHETAATPKAETAAPLFDPSAPRAPGTDGGEAAAESGGDGLIGLGYRGSDGAVTCALCDIEMEWEDCQTCGGDGVEDAYEDDPINCSPGEEMPCRECRGRGGFWWCDNRDCKTHECRRILRAKPARPSERGSNAEMSDANSNKGQSHER